MLRRKRVRSHASPEAPERAGNKAVRPAKRQRPLVESTPDASDVSDTYSLFDDDSFKNFNVLVAAMWKQPLALIKWRCTDFGIPTASKQSMVLTLAGAFREGPAAAARTNCAAVSKLLGREAALKMVPNSDLEVMLATADAPWLQSKNVSPR
eukprot:c4854_g1_i1.p2 GENE.c4854_g1_i1~~c4854_g1_i1.p2  ORF type:complete len:152 (+),score=8.96 c4854_g1_i1:345-800(+)